MDCENLRDDALDVLYGEADEGKARRVAEHQARCAACREEMAALRRLRRTLAEWTLPETVSSRGAERSWTPGRALTGLAAAAGLALALGVAVRLSGAGLRYENGRASFSVGRADRAEVQELLAAQETRHRREIEAIKASLAVPLAPSTARPRDAEDLLRRATEMIRESEARQAVALNASLADFAQRTEAQRRYDLARVGAGLSYLDGKTGQQVARTTELMGYLLEASQKR